MMEPNDDDGAMPSPEGPKRLPSLIVALVGRPNVGKSTLFNRLTRSREAIVDPTPGVTRDRHYGRLTWNEQPLIVIDTGGLDAGAADSLTSGVHAQTMCAIEEAEVIVFLLDGRQGLTPADLEVAELLRRAAKPTYYVVNKIDGPEMETSLLPSFYELGVERLWPLAAEHGYGVRDLLDAVSCCCTPAPAPVAAGALPEQTIAVAFIGRPNVGKSSLINRIVGEERMLVSELPGTTRDSVDSLVTRKNENFLLIDTAGIRAKGKVREKLEKFSVIRALAALERCDLALVLLDAGEGITEQDTKIIGYSQESGRACILVVNKWDLVSGDRKRQQQIMEEVARATPFVEFAPVITVSALTGSGVNRLFPAMAEVFRQYASSFTTNRLNKLLQAAASAHPPPLVRGRRLKFFYTTQISSQPPTFAIVANYPKELHFSYHRYLVNQFRKGLGLDKAPLRIVFRERRRRQLGQAGKKREEQGT